MAVACFIFTSDAILLLSGKVRRSRSVEKTRAATRRCQTFQALASPAAGGRVLLRLLQYSNGEQSGRANSVLRCQGRAAGGLWPAAAAAAAANHYELLLGAGATQGCLRCVQVTGTSASLRAPASAAVQLSPILTGEPAAPSTRRNPRRHQPTPLYSYAYEGWKGGTDQQCSGSVGRQRKSSRLTEK